MYSSFLEDFVIKESAKISDAYWKYKKNGKILVVVDNYDNFKGIVTHNEIESRYASLNPDNPVSSIVNTGCKSVQYSDNKELMYGGIRNIFADNINIQCIPVLQDKNVIDLFTRQRAFWLQSYHNGDLPYHHYANGLYDALQTAKALGYKKISALEFGVAGGNGLRMLEIHALELSRIFNIEIEVYGFDSGEGLPYVPTDYRNRTFLWQNGDYGMDTDELKRKLRFAKLILGNIKNTLPEFIKKSEFAPIGFISIDTDMYTSAVDILKDLAALRDEMCIPRIEMYFDDLSAKHDCTGEDLAIREFNAEHQNHKISPEESYSSFKILHSFKHHLYNNNCKKERRELPHKAYYYI